MILRGLLIVTILTALPLRSYALSPLRFFRTLDEQDNVSISPGPSQGVDLAAGGLNSMEACNLASRSCRMKNIAACLTFSQSGSQEVYLLVENKGENPMNVKIMNFPANNTIKEIPLSSHQIKKIKISTDVELSLGISVNSKYGDCMIWAEAPAPQNKYPKYPSHGTYVTLTNGAYLAILLLIVGGTLTFVKSRFRGRHLDGVPYHELEMGNSTALSELNVEEHENEEENWDEDWDDGWIEEKTVKSDSGNPGKVKQANGLTTDLPVSNGKRKEWND